MESGQRLCGRSKVESLAIGIEIGDTKFVLNRSIGKVIVCGAGIYAKSEKLLLYFKDAFSA
jgi:hypothetical protein